MFTALVRRWRRQAAAAPPHVRLPGVRLPTLNLGAFDWEDVRRFAQGEGLEWEPKGSMILPAVLTVAGAGAAFWWWRWAQSRGESDTGAPAAGPQLLTGEPSPQEVMLDEGLAVLGAPETRTLASRDRAVQVRA